MKELSIITAAAENMAIGRKGTIPWHISADFKYFKQVTLGHTVLMGRGTWRSLNCRQLPGRRNLVVTTSPLTEADMASGAEFFPSIDAAIAATSPEESVFSIGGGSVYRQTIELATKIYLTKVYVRIDDADTFFPEIDASKWKETSRSPMGHDEASGLDYEFIVYERA